jgi:5'-nucleotidase
LYLSDFKLFLLLVHMHILVTNDDGIQAPGLLALAQEMVRFGKVTVIAPDRNWSASGHVKTMERPLRVKQVQLLSGLSALTTDGAPSDCVAMAVLGLIEDPIDLVVSGINPHANLGHDVTYSGTVTAAMEAAIWGLPSLAVSLDSPDGFSEPLDYKPAALVAGKVAERIRQHGLPPHTLLNVNIPFLTISELKGYQVTRMGMRVYRDQLITRHDPRNRPYYWIGGESPTGVPDEGTDFGALSRGMVSITPMQLDMTSYKLLEKMRSWEWDLNSGDAALVVQENS